MKTKQEIVLFQSLVSEIEEECAGNTNSQVQNERRKILEAVQDYMKVKDNKNDPPKQNRKEGTETINQPSEKNARRKELNQFVNENIYEESLGLLIWINFYNRTQMNA